MGKRHTGSKVLSLSPKNMQTRLEHFHMVASALTVLSVALLLRLANGLSESSSTTTVGRFPFLMPKVIPYKVSQNCGDRLPFLFGLRGGRDR